MTLGWVVAGTVAQLMLGYFLFMLVVVSASSMSGIDKLAKVHSKILALSLFGLPASCVVSAGMLIHLYRTGGGSSSWWWHALPLATAALYLLYAIRLGKRIEVFREKKAGLRNSTGEGK